MDLLGEEIACSGSSRIDPCNGEPWRSLSAASRLAFSDDLVNLAGMAGKVFRHEHRVTYAECTVGNHIYYSRYLDLLEAVRGEFLRHLGQPLRAWQERDTLFPVVECRLRYRAAARYDDVITTELWLTAAEKVRLNFCYRLVGPGGRILVEAVTLHVCTSFQDKPKRLPEELAAMLQPFVDTEPGGGV